MKLHPRTPTSLCPSSGDPTQKGTNMKITRFKFGLKHNFGMKNPNLKFTLADFKYLGVKQWSNRGITCVTK